MILGTAFIDKESLRIETNCRQIDSRGFQAVANVQSFEDDVTIQLGTSAVNKQRGAIKTNLAIFRVAKAKAMPQKSKAL